MSAPPEAGTAPSAGRRGDDLFGPRPEPARGLKAAARSGSRWSAIQQGGGKLASVLVFLVLARLLTPADFGVVALATIFITLLQVLVQGGFGGALIQRRDLTPAHADTVFWISVVSATVLAGGLAIVSGPLALAYRMPVLAPVLQVLGLALIISALGAAQGALLRRNLRFKALAIRAVTSNLIGGLVGIGVALAGYGVWALVAQYVAFNALQTGLLWALSGWRPGLGFSWSCFRDVFAFSRNTLGNQLTQFTNERTDDFLIGSWLGAVPLGIYSVAYRLLSAMSDFVNQMLLIVAFPVFSRLQDDIKRLARAYDSVLAVGAAISFPAYLYFTVAAPDVTVVLFGRQWAEAAPIMQILAVFGALQTTVLVTDACLNALGKPHIVFRVRLANTLVQVAAFAVAVPFGLKWVAFSLVVRAYLMAPLAVWWLRSSGVTTYGRWAARFVTPVTATLVMLGAMEVLMRVLHDWSPLVRLLIVTPSGAVVYVAMLSLIDRPLLSDLVGLVRPGSLSRGRHRLAEARPAREVRREEP